MSEADWQSRVVDYARLRGWWVWHDADSRKNAAGLPDLLLVRQRLVWAELKTERGRVSATQKDVMRRFVEAGAEVHIWRPSAWPDVMEVLR